MRTFSTASAAFALAAVLVWLIIGMRSGGRIKKDQQAPTPVVGRAGPAIACALDGAELKQRSEQFAVGLKPSIREVKELEAGYALRFAPSDKVLEGLFAWITGERTCCGFVTYRVTVEAAEGPIWFQMTGPEGTKEFLHSALELGD